MVSLETIFLIHDSYSGNESYQKGSKLRHRERGDQKEKIADIKQETPHTFNEMLI